jgi:hypothetical protein
MPSFILHVQRCSQWLRRDVAVHRRKPTGIPLLAFFDTEFTDLALWPCRLSVGPVTDHGPDREFYAELTDPERIDAAHRFGRGAVLPQFGRVADAVCTHAELGLSFQRSCTSGLRISG